MALGPLAPGPPATNRTDFECNRTQLGSSWIRPLFRDKDVQSMSSAFDLLSYDAVRVNADKILAAVANGSVPCDGPWPAERVGLFRG